VIFDHDKNFTIGLSLGQIEFGSTLNTSLFPPLAKASAGFLLTAPAEAILTGERPSTGKPLKVI
jgi:hypothetical protein